MKAFLEKTLRQREIMCEAIDSFREEMLDLQEKLLEAEASRLRGTKTYSLDEVNQKLVKIINESSSSRIARTVGA